ncbi:hypothetical protein OBBRIDRAFT_869275 [Obba rivulosa]|uniref:Uncharacterized protein n=1 Tax=Obba rivulosa TaxID=1052685 RepID=A0A8E2DDN4_9APHY|nr:hypothetical protein OBBRIDRAFT_869275 [Obba rivulosa]
MTSWLMATRRASVWSRIRESAVEFVQDTGTKRDIISQNATLIPKLSNLLADQLLWWRTARTLRNTTSATGESQNIEQATMPPPNNGVDREAVLTDVKELLKTEDGCETMRSFSLAIAHNLDKDALDELIDLLWADSTNLPLIVVRSAAFLAEFFIQSYKHAARPLVFDFAGVS